MEYPHPIFLLLIFSIVSSSEYSLPSQFSAEDQILLDKVIQEAQECRKTMNSSFFEEVDKNVSRVLNWKDKHTKLGYKYCFPWTSAHEERTAWDSLRLSQKGCLPFPKIIHQQWNDMNIPPQWAELHNIWKSKNPDWLVLLWTETSSKEWLQKHFPWFMDVFLSYPYDIERIDAFRYFFLYAYGGMYVDIDFECMESLSRYVHMMNSPVGLISPDNSGVSNSLMLTIPKHSFWTYCINQLNHSLQMSSALFKHEHVINAAGPGFIGRAVAVNGSQVICTFPRDMFSPCNFCQKTCDTCVNCFTIHHYAKIWNDWSSTLTNWIQCSPEYFITTILCVLFFGIFLYKRFIPRIRMKKRQN